MVSVLQSEDYYIIYGIIFFQVAEYLGALLSAWLLTFTQPPRVIRWYWMTHQCFSKQPNLTKYTRTKADIWIEKSQFS